MERIREIGEQWGDAPIEVERFITPVTHLLQAPFFFHLPFSLFTFFLFSFPSFSLPLVFLPSGGGGFLKNKESFFLSLLTTIFVVRLPRQI